MEKINFSIENKRIPFEPNHKRFCIPVVINWECPICKIKQVYKPDYEYISYPIINKPFSFDLYCYNCDKNFTIDVIINAELKAYNYEYKIKDE